MSWNGNNGGGNNPWGNGGGRGPGGGNQPPNIDEVIKKGQEQLKQALPGGFGSIGLILLVILGLWLASGYYSVKPDEQGVVLRFGQYIKTTGEGPHWHLPYPVESVIKVNVTQERSNQIGSDSNNGTRNQRYSRGSSLDSSLMLTGDNSIVDVKFSVVWNIREADKFLFNLKNPEQAVADVSKSAMREVVGQNKIEDIITRLRDSIERQVQTKVQETLDGYASGISIRRVQISASNPPDEVVEAFRDVQRATADRERAVNLADAYKNEIIPQANGEASQLTQQAEAYKAEVKARADGEAARFLSVYNEYVKAKNVTRKRIYLETMEEILAGMDKIIVEGGKNGSGVVPYLPLNELKKKKEN
ncbi:FtsH protease activity modulator HflK [Temperatibacter marinus]|uniref:Protein HflK n=1 Tax=Temperatibacter marinus TaxID=1456591 RepID=A0AA52EGP9_9PROT|nr:FtsH protease activity modulator HflK [Temperatibacter marinus]WND02823.1 FtsH protease activity modulator HflK [Temperatibacter marinus]